MGALMASSCTVSTPTATGAEIQSANIVIDRVKDGDSLDAIVDGEPLEVRLLGINAPELFTVGNQRTCNGEQAREQLIASLAGGSLTFEADEIDRFGRQLGEIYVADEPVGALQVDAGWALALWFADDQDLADRMQAAAAAGLGMWGDTCGRPEVDHLEFVDHQFNPPGDDREQVADEWIELRNTGAAVVDLSDWTLKDETSSNRFLLDGLVIDADQTVRIRVGRGPSDAHDYFLGRDNPIWSNGGDTALLLDPEGLVVSYLFVAG